jgi:hypothetical protein
MQNESLKFKNPIHEHLESEETVLTYYNNQIHSTDVLQSAHELHTKDSSEHDLYVDSVRSMETPIVKESDTDISQPTLSLSQPRWFGGGKNATLGGHMVSEAAASPLSRGATVATNALTRASTLTAIMMGKDRKC